MDLSPICKNDIANQITGQSWLTEREGFLAHVRYNSRLIKGPRFSNFFEGLSRMLVTITSTKREPTVWLKLDFLKTCYFPSKGLVIPVWDSPHSLRQ